MSFTEMLIKKEKVTAEVLDEAKIEDAESMLRKGGMKIKLVTNTSFGKQIDFAKKYDEEEIKEILKDFTIKIKGKSVFIVD